MYICNLYLQFVATVSINLARILRPPAGGIVTTPNCKICEHKISHGVERRGRGLMWSWPAVQTDTYRTKRAKQEQTVRPRDRTVEPDIFGIGNRSATHWTAQFEVGSSLCHIDSYINSLPTYIAG